MHYVRTSGGSMMPVNFKADLLSSDKKQVAKVKVKALTKTKKRSIFGSK